MRLKNSLGVVNPVRLEELEAQADVGLVCDCRKDEGGEPKDFVYSS